MFVYYLNVPINDSGISEFEGYSEEMPNVRTFELTEKEYLFLKRPNGLFQKFDTEFGTIIDVCEEERLAFENLPKAIEYTEKAIKKASQEIEISALSKVKDSLTLAKESGTFWEIDIYVE